MFGILNLYFSAFLFKVNKNKFSSRDANFSFCSIGHILPTIVFAMHQSDRVFDVRTNKTFYDGHVLFILKTIYYLT